jgi:acyl carrier protein
MLGGSPVRDRIKGVMANVFELDVAEVPDDASTLTLTGWDSLRHLELVLALEREFRVRVPADEMLDLTSVEEIESFVQRADTT